MAVRRCRTARSLMFHFTNSSLVIHVRDRAARIRAVNIEL
jgi:hypothetical protein